jgi:hypothetical protein
MATDINEIAHHAEMYLHSVGGTPKAFAQQFGKQACEEYAHALASIIQIKMMCERHKTLQEN